MLGLNNEEARKFVEVFKNSELKRQVRTNYAINFK